MIEQFTAYKCRVRRYCGFREFASIRSSSSLYIFEKDDHVVLSDSISNSRAISFLKNVRLSSIEQKEWIESVCEIE